jgi:hypothetical protein
MISMLRGCRPSERTSWLGSASFSSTSTSTSWSRSSLASIIPVGPPPLMITSNMKDPQLQKFTAGNARTAPGRRRSLRPRGRIRLPPQENA